MQPWLLDADDIRPTDALDDQLLHKTDAISRFLQRDAQDKCFLVATKGFGKTFLLKAKRLSYGRSGMLWLPENDLVDKPVGGPRVFNFEEGEAILEDESYWTNIWTIAIIIAILKTLNTSIADFSMARLGLIYSDTRLIRVTDIFANVMVFNREEYFKTIQDLNQILIPAFKASQSQVAIFIDNVDEYFDIHLRRHDESSQSSVGSLFKEWWYQAQIGLAKAIYQLKGANHHIKMFCSLRREAFEKLLSGSQMAQQFRGAAIYLNYSDDDLIEIFCKNVGRESPDRLVDPTSSDLIGAMLGREMLTVDHRRTGEREGFGEYLLRHTLRRPRDIIQIGGNLADISPRRRTVEAIKESINNSAHQIGAAYLNEVSRHIDLYYIEKLLARLPSNIISRAQIETISKEHQSSWGDKHPFCTLYKIGLLGYVDGPTATNRRVQRFAAPGDKLFQPDGSLPPASYYLVHSVLDSEIRKLSETYRRSFNRWNIVSAGRDWREPSGKFFLIKGDIVNFSAIDRNPDLAATFVPRFKSLFCRLAEDCQYAEIYEGDSFRIVDVNPHRIFQILRQLIDGLQDVIIGTRIRVGGDFGFIKFSERDDFPEQGEALRIAARLEPLARANHALVTERFARQAGERQLMEFNLVKEGEISAPFSAGEFNIGKEGEPPIASQLFQRGL